MRSLIAVGIYSILSVVPALAAEPDATGPGPRPSFALPGEEPGWPLPFHVDQFTLNQHSFSEIYGWGEKLFKADFNRLDGVGANISGDAGVSLRFMRAPNINKPGYNGLLVARPGGPEAQNCWGCHTLRRTTGTGVVLNESRDQRRTGDINKYINRDTTQLGGSGALQLLAEQSTAELLRIRDQATAAAKAQGQAVTATLMNSNGVSYGSITARPDGTLDTSAVKGVSNDLVVRPFHLKGLVPFMRLQSAVANDVSVGMQGPEVTADAEHVDEDGDHVVNEFTAGDMTAIVAFTAAQPRPVTKLELSEHLGGKYTLTAKEIATIKHGEQVFSQVGCGSCHTPKYVLKDRVFREPSSSIFHRFDANAFPFFGGRDPLAYGLDWKKPVSFDITANPVVTCHVRHEDEGAAQSAASRNGRHCWRQFEVDSNGNAIVRSYGDQRWHDMGPQLAAEVDELGNGASTWRGKELWGVADTGPWLHDSRATTLPEAIWWHGGEAQAVRDAYFAMPASEQEAVIAFLKNLVLYTPSEG
jgi:hypothetical protein